MLKQPERRHKMTVKEWINRLEKFNPDLQVMVDMTADHYGDISEPVIRYEPNGRDGPFVEIYN